MNAQPAQQNNTPNVLGIIGIVVSIICFIIGPIAGLILGFVAKGQAASSGLQTKLPQAAIIVGAIFLVLHILVLILNIVGVFAFGGPSVPKP